MKKEQLIILLFLSLMSCAFIKAPRDFKYCYYENGFMTEFPINMDGYFIGAESYTFDGWPEKLSQTLLFYRDATCGTSFMSSPIDSNEMKSYIEKEGQGADKYLFEWGAYRIYNDTIKTQAFQQMYTWDYWMENNNYKIIDRNTLIRIPSIEIHNAPNRRRIKDIHVYDTLRFVPYANRPDSACNLKKYRWFKYKEKRK